MEEKIGHFASRCSFDAIETKGAEIESKESDNYKLQL